MAINVTMPKWGLTMKEGKVSKWFKSEGDSVQKGEDLFEVETEKITNKVESPGSGQLFQIVVPVGTKVPVGTILAIIAEPGEQPERIEGIQTGETAEAATATSKPPSAPEEPAEKKFVPASPAARRLADLPPWEPSVRSGYLRRYAQAVTSACTGAVYRD